MQMSNCLVVKKDNNIYIGADTAISTQKDGVYYRLNGETEKLFQYGDIVLFCAGDLLLANSLITQLDGIRNINKNVIQKISRIVYMMNKRQGNLEVVLVEDGNVYSLSSFDNFEENELDVPSGELGIWSAGFHTQECVATFEKELKSGNGVADAYKNTYDKLSSEVIGGNMNLYSIVNGKVADRLDSEIKDNRIINKLDVFDYSGAHLIVAERLYGKAIVGENLIIGDEEGTLELKGNLLTIQDREKVVRLLLGEYEKDMFGLKLMNKTGQDVILDEDGMLQTWQVGETDNVDIPNGISLWVHLPENTLSVREAILSFKMLPFRSYGKSTEADGGIVESTSNGGAFVSSTKNGGGSSPTSASGGGVSTSTASGGSVSTSTASGGNSAPTSESGGGYVDSTAAGGDHTHDLLVRLNPGTLDVQPALYSGQGGTVELKSNTGVIKSWGGSGDHTHKISIPPHTHTVNVPSHTHSFVVPSHTHNFSIPSHTHTVTIAPHSHGIDIPNHSHSITIPPHTHEIDHGIFTSTTASNIGIVINGTNRTTELGGSFAEDRSDIRITKYMKLGEWNEVRLTSDSLGRISADIFMQAFMGTHTPE